MSTNTALSVPRLKRLLPRLGGKRLGVVGDLMLDRYVWGRASRLSPEAAVPIVDFVEQSERLGGAGNVAANLAALGAKTEAFGVIGPEKGQDSPGHAVREGLHASGIADRGVLSDSRRITTVKTRIIARHQHIVRIDHERREPLRPQIEEKLVRQILSAVSRLDGMVISDYNKGLITDSFADRILSRCHKEKVPVFVSPKTSRLYAHRGARIVVCNIAEAEKFVTHAVHDEKSVEDAGHALLRYFGCGAVVITRGAKGMNLFDENSPRSTHIPATGREVTYARVGQPGMEPGATGRQVFDVTGASDTVLSVLALAAVSGALLVDAAMLANVAAGVVVGKLGTASVTPPELERALEEIRG